MAEGDAQPPGMDPQPYIGRDVEPPAGEHVHERATERAPEPVAEREPERMPEHVAVAPRQEPPPAPEAMEHERPRRKSTVREPAPVSFGGEHGTAAPTPPQAPQPAEAPQPVVISPEPADEADRPRRSGWWSRRVLGKD